MAGVEPEAKGHAAPAIGSAQRGLVMLGVLKRLANFDKTDFAIFWSDDLTRAFLCAVLDAEIDRVHAALFSQFVDHGLGGEGGVGGARSAVGRGLGPIHHYVEAVDLEVRDVVRSDAAHRAGTYRRSRKRTRFERQPDFGSVQTAVFGGAHLDLHP